MNLYTIGFAQKSAEEFFGLIRKHNIELLLDIRLNNKSQLAGFTKEHDLKYFLKAICSCRYEHCIEYAPTKEILDSYKAKTMSWNEYVKNYNALILKRGDYRKFYEKYSSFNNICLLCSEPTADQCHRRLLAEIIASTSKDIVIRHI